MKKHIAAVLIVLMVFSTTLYGYEAPTTDESAEILKDIGVFKGSNMGFELDREPTRLEGLIILLRLLGKEDEALSINYGPSYFSDVPGWGVAYTNYAYFNGLTKGIGNGEFGSDQTMNAKAFSTFVLRALGYDDSAGDFNYSDAHVTLSSKLSFDIQESGFTRGRVVDICYEAMYLFLKDTTTPLLAELIQSDDISIDALYLFTKEPRDNFTYETTLVDADNSSEKLILSIEDDQLWIDATYPIPYQYAWLWYNDGNRTNRFTGNDLDTVVSLGAIAGDAVNFTIYLNDQEHGTYQSWIYDYKIKTYDGEFKFEYNPVIARNQVIYDYYTENQVDYLASEWQIYPDDPQVATLAQQITNGITDEREKIKAIHYWIAENIYYDLDNPGVINLNNYDHDLNDTICVIDTGKGICEGYANLAVSLLRNIGIESRKVSGVAIQPSETFFISEDEFNMVSNHTWIEVLHDGKWMICDPTWDSNNTIQNGVKTKNAPSGRYFDISIEAFSATHHILDYRTY